MRQNQQSGRAKMSDKFNVKWNDFQNSLARTFRLLRYEEEFFDVSLVSDDQKMMSAHKLVLSASSPYFKHILTHNKHSHPLLCLDGVSSGELQFVLDYIYQGEVQIFQENLDRFLTVAQRFQLEGLMTLPETNKQEESYSEPSEDSFLSISRAQYSAEREPSQVKREVRRRSETTALVSLDVDTSNIEEVDEKIVENIQKDHDGTFSCRICGKSGVKQKVNMKKHVEIHIEGLSFPCQHCGKTFRSRNLLHTHTSTFHRK